MAENARLRRICDALIERVEESNMAPTAPYAAFQHSVVLAEQVRERTQALREANQQLLEEIEERRRVEARLREATAKAERASISKTKFVAAVSHDLMQPLNAARLFTSALQDAPDQNTDFMLTHINTALRDLESLITTLADASKLDAGVVTAEPVAFPCASCSMCSPRNTSKWPPAKGCGCVTCPPRRWCARTRNCSTG